jgi:hypothetical protein
MKELQNDIPYPIQQQLQNDIPYPIQQQYFSNNLASQDFILLVAKLLGF